MNRDRIFGCDGDVENNTSTASAVVEARADVIRPKVVHGGALHIDQSGRRHTAMGVVGEKETLDPEEDWQRLKVQRTLETSPLSN